MSHSGIKTREEYLSPYAGIYSQQNIVHGSLPSLAFAPGELGDLSLFPGMPHMQRAVNPEDNIDVGFIKKTSKVLLNGRIEGGIHEPEYYEYSPSREDTWEDGAQAIEDFDWSLPVDGGEDEQVSRQPRQPPVMEKDNANEQTALRDFQAAADLNTASFQLPTTPTGLLGKNGQKLQQELFYDPFATPPLSGALPVHTPASFIIPTPGCTTIGKDNVGPYNPIGEQASDQGLNPASSVDFGSEDTEMMDSCITSDIAQDDEEPKTTPIMLASKPTGNSKDSVTLSTEGSLSVMSARKSTAMEIDSHEQMPVAERKDPGQAAAIQGDVKDLPNSSAATTALEVQQQQGYHASLEEQLQQAVINAEINKGMVESEELAKATLNQNKVTGYDKTGAEYAGVQNDKVTESQQGSFPQQKEVLAVTIIPTSMALDPGSIETHLGSDKEPADKFIDVEEAKSEKHILSSSEAGGPAKKKQKNEPGVGSNANKYGNDAVEEDQATIARKMDPINVLIKAQQDLSLNEGNETLLNQTKAFTEHSNDFSYKNTDTNGNHAVTTKREHQPVAPGPAGSDVDMDERFSDVSKSPEIQSLQKENVAPRATRQSVSSRELLSLASTLTPNMHLTLQEHARGDTKRSRKSSAFSTYSSDIDSSECSVGSDESDVDERKGAGKKKRATRKTRSSESAKPAARKSTSVSKKKTGKKQTNESDSELDDMTMDEPETKSKKPARSSKADPHVKPLSKPLIVPRTTSLHQSKQATGNAVKNALSPSESELSSPINRNLPEPTTTSPPPSSQPASLLKNKYGFKTRSPALPSSPSVTPNTTKPKPNAPKKKLGTAAKNRAKREVSAVETTERRTTRRASAVEEEIRRQEKEENIGLRLRSRSGEGAGK